MGEGNRFTRKMDDCLKSIEGNICLPEFLQKLETLAALLPEDTVEVDKAIAKTVLTAFMNNWRFASKEESDLLESYFSLLSCLNFFTPVEKPFLKVLTSDYANASAKWVYRLFRVCCILYMNAADDLADSVLETKLKLMEAIAEKSPKLTVCSIHYFLSTCGLKTEEEVDSFIAKAITKCCANKETLLLCACNLCSHIRGAEAKQTSQATLVKSYLSVLSTARKTPSSSVIMAGGIIASQADHATLTKDFFPSLSRAVKRNADMGVPCMLAAVRSLKVDGSSYLSFLIDTCMYFFKQGTTEAGNTIQAVLKQLVQHCSDGEAIIAFVESVLKEMDSMRPTPVVKKQVYMGVHAVLQGMNARVLGKTACQGAALQLETVLLASVKKESNALAKATLLDCLAHAVLLAESPSEDVLSVVRGALQPTNAALLPTLYCLYAILKVSTTVSEVDTLQKSLEEAIKRAIAKPFLCGREGILALPSLIRLSVLANQELSPMVAESFKEGSFLFQASLYNSANKDDERLIAWCHAALHCTVELVLSTHILSDAEQTAFLGFFYSQIMTENPAARESAFALLDRLATSRARLTVMLAAFQQFLITMSSQHFYNDEYPLPHEPLLSVLQSLAHGAVQWEELGSFAWCASHPFLCIGRNHHAPWHAVYGSLCRTLKELVVSEEMIANILSILQSEELSVTATSAVLSAATQRMLENLATVPEVLKALFAAIESQLSSEASSSAATSVTSKDLSIWQTPANVEWKPRQEDSGYVPEVSSQTRKTRSKKGSNPFGKNDDRWAEELQAEINKDKIAKEEAEKAIAARTKTLEEQAAIRANIDAIALPYRHVLLTVAALARGAGEGFLPYLSECLMWVSGMLNNPLVCALARNVFGDCTIVVSNHALRAALDNSLHTVFFQPFYDGKLVDTVKPTLDVAFELFKEQPLPSCTLSLFLPLLRALAFSKETNTHSSVTALLELYADDEDELKENTVRYCRYEVCEILLELLRVSPRVEPSPEGILMSYCDAAPALQPREVLLLSGDRGMLSASEDVRLNSVLNLASLEGSRCNPLYVTRLFMLQYDEDGDIAEEAQQQWEEKQLKLTPSFYIPLFQLLGHSVDKVRHAAGSAVAHGLLLFPGSVSNVLSQVEKKCLEVEAIEDPRERASMSTVVESLFYMLQKCAECSVFAVDQLNRFLDILFIHAFACESDVVRIQGMQTGEAFVESYGKENKQVLLEYLSARMMAMEQDADTEEEMIRQDHMREGCVVLLGKVTCFLEDGDARIIDTTNILMSSLAIPAASVQEAIARCLTPLFKYEALRANAGIYVDKLLKQLTEGETYAARRGAALGLAGAIKGMSSKAFKEYNINEFIEKAAQSDSPHAREGAMLILEALFDTLTFMFEPYVVRFLPLLLENFSNKDEGVREAAKGASRSVMRNLSPHGVKLVMPKVLEGLVDSRWRTKQAAIQMLGSMAYCSPQSLSSCLPRIVPVLTESCNDAQTAIQEAARSALLDIGNVIRTPEIADLQEVLLRALTEPHLYTGSALKTLTETSFHHTIDAPSLSLIVPILMRGLSDRATETKKKAALIVGNICSLANKSDVMPYLPQLLPPLKKCLMDPLPDVRAVAAHSIGMLGHEVGEEEMKDVLDWLIEKVYEDSTVAERSGAAQGLADLLASVNPTRFQQVLDELLKNSSHPRACVREGVLWTISFLPSTLGERFAKLIPVILPSIISGLADESDMVAEVALRAGQVLVKTYAKTQMSVVLPPLKAAMMDDDWRIRQSSIQLMGELLYTLGHTKAVGISESENDTGLSTDAVELRLQKELGMDTWIEVMSALFFLTTDVTAAVRQSSVQVWKSVVNNTPRTLKKLLGELTSLCFNMLTSDSENKRTLAARCLGELVQKLGEFVIPHVLRVLNEGLENEDPVVRQIICIGFVQVLTNCSSAVLKTWGDQFLESLKVSICDESEYVRAAAAEALTELQRRGNGNAFEAILPILLGDLEDPNEERQHRALNGLKQIILLQGRQVINILLMRLTAKPYTVSHMRIMQQIIPSTTKFLHFFLSDTASEFLEFLYGKNDEVETPAEDRELAAAIQETLCCMVDYIQTFGVHFTLTFLDKVSCYENNGWRRESCSMVRSFIQNSIADWSDDIQMILRLLLKRSADSDMTVIKEAWSALSALLTKKKVEEILPHVSFISNMIATVISTERYKPGVDMNTYMLPAFTMKDGLKPLFLMLQKGIMVASAERKADCASLICDLVQYAPAENVRLYALQVTGPLIRIIGDKYPPEVRVTIFRALNLLLAKSGDALRPFLPQLQTTFIRALKDSSKGVREQGGEALVHVIRLSNRIDNVVNDLSNDVENNSTEIRESVMTSLKAIMASVGERLQPATRTTVEQRMVELLANDEEDVRVLAAGVLGVTLSFSDDATFKTIMENTILLSGAPSTDVAVRHGKCVALGQALKYNTERCKPYHGRIIEDDAAYIKDDVLLVRMAGISVCKYVLNIYNSMSEENKQLVLKDLITELTACIYHPNSSVRFETVVSISLFGKVCKDTNVDLLNVLVPTLLKSVQDSYVPVKLTSERALLHLLQIHENPQVLENYLRSVPPMDAKYLKTYVQRVLVKLPKNSDDDIGDF